MLPGKPIAPLTSFRLERLDREPGLLRRAGHKPADRVTLPAHFVHDLADRGALGPLQQRDYLGRLGTLARSGGFHLRCFLPLERGLGRGGLLSRPPLCRRTLGGPCATGGLLPGPGLRGLGRRPAASASGCAPSPKSRMRSQILVAATLLVLNRFTGATPGRQFQVATIRSGGHPAIRSASSWRLLNVSNGVVVAAAASSAVANALIAVSWSIVKLVIIVSPWPRSARLMTWITRKCLKSKGNLNAIFVGEREAMMGAAKPAERHGSVGPYAKP